MNYCRRIFGNLPDIDIQKNIDIYKGTNIEGTRIFFTQAVEDPWKYAGM